MISAASREPIQKPYCDPIVAIYCSHLVAVLEPYSGRIGAVYWPYLVRIVAVSWPHRGHCYSPNIPKGWKGVVKKNTYVIFDY